MKLSGFILILTAALVICSCGGRHTAGEHQGSGTGAIDSVSVINPKYAQGFKIFREKFLKVTAALISLSRRRYV